MINIFKYNSYREFLQDYFSEKKDSDSKYSLNYFSKLIESSDSYLKQVLAGRRTLNLEKARLLADKLKLKQLETSYFLTLIIKESSESEELQDYFESILTNFKEISKFDYNQEENKKSIFKNSLVWEIYTLLGIKDNNMATSTLTNKRATEEEIQKSIEHLINSKAIVKEENNYKTKNVVFEHSDEVRLIYQVALERAIEYLQETATNGTEYFDSFCLTTNENEFAQIQKLLEDTKNKMANIVKSSEKKDRICYYNTNLFFVSKNADKK